MIEVDEKRFEDDIHYRIMHLKEFTDFTDTDSALVKETLPLLAKYAETVVDAVYDHLFRWTSTAKYFIDEDGMIRDFFLHKRKETLTHWLIQVGSGSFDGDLMNYFISVGHAHRQDSGSLPMQVPRHYMLCLMSVVQSTVTSLLLKEIKDSIKLVAAITAWNKMLMLVLEMMLSGLQD